MRAIETRVIHLKIPSDRRCFLQKKKKKKTDKKVGGGGGRVGAVTRPVH